MQNLSVHQNYIWISEHLNVFLSKQNLFCIFMETVYCMKLQFIVSQPSYLYNLIIIIKTLLGYFPGITASSVCIFGTSVDICPHIWVSHACLYCLPNTGVLYVLDYMCMYIRGFLWRAGCSTSPDVLFEHVCTTDMCIMGGFNRCTKQLDSSTHRCGHFASSTGKSSIQALFERTSFHRFWIGPSSFFMVIACNLICTPSISSLLYFST